MKRHNIVKLCCPQTYLQQIPTSNPNNPLLGIHWVSADLLWHCSEYDLTLRLVQGQLISSAGDAPRPWAQVIGLINEYYNQPLCCIRTHLWGNNPIARKS